MGSVDNRSDTLSLANMDNTSDTLSLANMDNTSDTLSLAKVDNTSDTLSLAKVDNTSDTLSLANMDNTSDTLSLAKVDHTSDTLSLANMDNTSDTLSLANLDNTSDTLSLANVDNTSDTLSLARLDNTSDTLSLANLDNTSDTLSLANVDNTSDTLSLANVDNTSDTLSLANVDNTSDTLSLANLDNTSDTLSLANIGNTSDTLSLANVDNTSDTLSLATLDRDNQGPWEFEYSYGNEGDLHQHYDRCKKNPGHKNFIPVDKFSIQDLPEDYRHKEMVEYIRAVSDLTVRVSVKYVSDKRPAIVSGVGRRTVGTGWVYVINEFGIHPCKCKDCRNSSTAEMNYAMIIINTASHLVFNDEEGEHTTCDLFFDRGGTPQSCSDAVTLTGMTGVFTDVTEDICYMDHYTHNLDLARRLRQTIKQMDELKLTICNKIPRMSQLKTKRSVHDKQPLVFLVSHPHGCSKQISLGCWTSADVFNNVIMSFLYNTPSCPGSSGANVCVLPEFASPGFKLLFAVYDSTLLPTHRAHCGASGDKPGSNFFRISGVIRTNGFVSVEMLQLNKGALEDSFCCVEEEDQHQHYAACKKNPGHENFFPVEKFSLDDLPPFYRSDDVMKFIKLTSDLTVRLSVKYVSEKRPETVPGTDIPYPWFNNRGSKLTRVGNGWIKDIGEFINQNCNCRECRNSSKRKPLLNIEIQTVGYLVYDKLEAEHTTCHLFFDSGETPDVCKNVVTLTDVIDFIEDIQSNTCILRYRTHNQDLTNRLQRTNDQYIYALYSMSKRKTVKFTKQVKQDEEDQRKQDPPLNIVISHPHGCAKKISICCCGNPGNGDTEENQCSHSSIFCPGSSGAPVIDMSRKLFYPLLVAHNNN